jgi:hypothetical protein
VSGAVRGLITTRRYDSARTEVDISITVSPIKDEKGEIVGASKIARDFAQFTRARERQDLLLREMDHRVKNLFALAISVLRLSGRSAGSVPELIESTSDRLSALARAHTLTLSSGLRELPQAANRRRSILSFRQ